MAHGDHAVRTLAEGHNEAISLVSRNHGLRHRAGLQLETHILLHFAEDAFHLRDVTVPLDADLLLVRHRNDHDGLRFAGNRVAQVAAADRSELQLRLRPYAREEPNQQLVGIGAALVDIVAGVTAHEAADSQLNCE